METKLRIHKYPEKILHKKCKPVKVIDEKIKKIFDEMRLLMIAEKGIGIAANQVGLDLRLALIEINDKVFKLINPCIRKKQGKTKFIEGCLSFPGLEVEINRSKKIWVSYLDEKAQAIDLELDGVLSVIFQHEIDHLNGIILSDRLTLLQKIKINPQLKEIKRKTKHDLSKQAKKF